MPDLWDVFQQAQIGASLDTAESAKGTALDANERSRSAYARLEAKVDTLALASQALWELVREHTGLTDQDIQRKVEEIDFRDGQMDKRMGGKLAPCAGCGRDLHTRLRACMYCGTAVARDAFDSPTA